MENNDDELPDNMEIVEINGKRGLRIKNKVNSSDDNFYMSMLTREPYDLPTVKISDRVVNDISEYTLDDITLENYQSHPSIKMPLSN